MTIMFVGAMAFTSCSTKENKANEDAQTESVDSLKKDSCCEKKDTCTHPCGEHAEMADSTAAE